MFLSLRPEHCRRDPKIGLSDISSWHKCEVPTELCKVRYQGQSGRHLLELSSSQFDPSRTFDLAEQSLIVV